MEEIKKNFSFIETYNYLHIDNARSANVQIDMWGDRMGKVGISMLSKRLSTLGIIRAGKKFRQVWEIDRFGSISKAVGVESTYPTWKTIIRNPGCRYEIGHDEDEVRSKLNIK